MNSVVFLIQIALAGTFLLSGVSKLRDPEGTRQALRGFQVPEALVPVGTYVLPVTELVGGVLVLLSPTARAGALLLSILLLAFIAAISVNLQRGRTPDCRCFGQVHSAPISWWMVARNVGLLLIAVVVAIRGGVAPTDAFDWVSDLTSGEKNLLSVVGALAAMTAAGFAILWRRQDGVAKPDDASIEEATPGSARLPVGSAAPAFALSNLEGTTVTLPSLLKDGLPTILVFTSPNCVHCEEVMPEIGQWQRSLAQAVTVAVVSSGNLDDVREKAETHRLTNVLVQERYEVLDAYGGGGTPSAISLTGDGIVSSELMEGANGVRAVLNEIMAERVRSLWQKATGEELPDPSIAVGDDLPEVTLPGDELSVRLHQLVGQRETMLLFWSATCGFCDAILKDVRELEKEWLSSAGHQMIFVLSSPPETNENLKLQSRQVLDPEFAVGAAFAVQGTPTAVLIGSDQKVASTLAVGTDSVLELIRARSPKGSGSSIGS
jgi:thiol-disulfide isomerase/thioredoxin/uncharacterized membrane protein YphA (DoxX/SURF4 family)